MNVEPGLNIDDKYKVVCFALRLIATSYKEHIDRLHTSPCAFANQILDYLGEDFSIPSDYEHVNELMHGFWEWRKENPPAA